jgi:hypothetical protein
MFKEVALFAQRAFGRVIDVLTTGIAGVVNAAKLAKEGQFSLAATTLAGTAANVAGKTAGAAKSTAIDAAGTAAGIAGGAAAAFDFSKFKMSDETSAALGGIMKAMSALSTKRAERQRKQEMDELFAKGVGGFFGGMQFITDFFNELMPSKPADFGAGDDASRQQQAKFVGVGDMNRRIQEALGGDQEAKDRKSLVAAAKTTAEETKKGTKLSSAVAAGITMLNSQISKLSLGFGQ